MLKQQRDRCFNKTEMVPLIGAVMSFRPGDRNPTWWQFNARLAQRWSCKLGICGRQIWAVKSNLDRHSWQTSTKMNDNLGWNWISNLGMEYKFKSSGWGKCISIRQVTKKWKKGVIGNNSKAKLSGWGERIRIRQVYQDEASISGWDKRIRMRMKRVTRTRWTLEISTARVQRCVPIDTIYFIYTLVWFINSFDLFIHFIYSFILFILFISLFDILIWWWCDLPFPLPSPHPPPTPPPTTPPSLKCIQNICYL